jgi:4-amino-4-deoxy-L-arabinose transferase-like glycosyltransferase
MQVTDPAEAADGPSDSTTALDGLLWPSAGLALCLTLVATWLFLVSGESTSGVAVLTAAGASALLSLIAWQEGAVARGESSARTGEVDFGLLLAVLVRHRDLVAVAGITAVAAVLRLWALDTVPPGLHGDEGWTGIDARRVLSEGWIGPYVTSALGQPAGPLYWVAGVLKVTGDSVYAVRFSLALLGIATIPLTYVATRLMFDRTTGFIAALLLAFLAWHIHFSRIAFMVISWPLLEMMATALLFAALKGQNKTMYFAMAGAVLGLGVYSYNAYPLFVIAVGIFLVAALFHSKVTLTKRVSHYAILGLCAAIVALPMLLYVVDPDKDYFAHHRAFSYLGRDEFEGASVSEKADLLVDRWANWVKGMTMEAQPDGADAAGAVPILHWSTTVLFLAGIAFCLWNAKKLESQYLLLMLLVIPIATVVTIGGGFRRTLGIAPYVAIIAAIPLAKAWLRAGTFNPLLRGATRLSIAAVLLTVMGFNYIQYFEKTAESSAMRSVFPVEITRASEYVAELPGEPYVYFFSDRWSYNYETRRYLASGLDGEDRSQKFGKRQDFDFDRRRDSVVVLLAPYLGRLEALKQMHPNGVEYHGRYDDRTIFIGYYLPAEAATEPRPDPNSEIRTRDEERRSDLAVLASALKSLLEAQGGYPSTNGNIQSACRYRAIDQLCVLEPEVGSDAFLDPRGNQEKYGYWYKSDGKTYSLFASMEGPVADTESCPPERHLQAENVKNVLCVRSP